MQLLRRADLSQAKIVGGWRRVMLLWSLIPGFAGAATWHQVFGDYEYTVSIDADSIERANGHVQAWVQQHFQKSRHSGEHTYNILNGLNSFDCKNKKVSLLQVSIFQDSKLIESYTPVDAGGNRPIIPGTVEYFAYKYLCVPEKK